MIASACVKGSTQSARKPLSKQPTFGTGFGTISFDRISQKTDISSWIFENEK